MSATTELARASDPDTSHEAAEKQQATLSTLQSVVYAIFKARGNLTDSELDAYYANNWLMQDWPQVRFETPRRRRSELTRRGLLFDTGERRLNQFGSNEVVWAVVYTEGQVA